MDIRSATNNSDHAVENGHHRSVRWSLRLLGGFELGVLPGGHKLALSGKRERALLAYLALSPKGRQPRRKLAALLWGDATDQTLLDNLRTCVWRLRKALGDAEHRLLASNEDDIVLDISAFDIDALAFRHLAVQASRAELEAAARLCRGEFLSGLDLDSEEFESWRRMEASRYVDQSVEVLARLMKSQMECAETERAIETGARILRLDPLHEATARHVMRLYANGGRRGAAIQLYRSLAETLERDADTQPEAETRVVFAAIAQTDRLGAASLAGANGAAQIAKPQIGAHVLAPVTRAPAGRWRFSLAALAGVFIVAIALASYWVVSKERRSTDGGSAALSSRQMPASGLTAIAVLPFDNLSGDPAQQFFSDGMTEEISSALAKVPGLQIVARTSAFQFRGNKDARQIGTLLGARYVIEGAVRKTENRVRITAQLIRTDTGLSVWSDSYERKLTDVFALQEDIATSIAEALRVSLAVTPGEHLVPNRDIAPDSYEQFLRAMPLVRARSTGTEQAIKILEPLLASNPNYAPAWALLARSYAMMPAFVSPYSTVPGQPGILQRHQRIAEYWPKSEAAARRAIKLDPKLADGYSALGSLMHFQGKLAAADDLFSKALTLDRYNPDTLGLRMNLLADVGDLGEAREIADKLLALDPYVPSWTQDAAEIFWEAGQEGKALKLLMPLIERPSVPSTLAMIYSARGRYGPAADVMETALKARGEMRQNQTQMWQMAVSLLRAAPGKATFDHGFPRLGRVDFVYLHVGAPEQALEVYESEVGTGLIGGQGNSISYLWHPSFAAARNTPRFKILMRNAGMVDYWRQRGWPNLCHPAGSTDFNCD
jgi:adenylate cyclase